MKKLLIVVFVVLLCGVMIQPVCAQNNITYDLHFPNAAHNEAEITLTLTNIHSDSVHIAMSRSSPGRYALHEFAKNVYNVSSVDENGDTLEIARPDLHHWVMSGDHQRIKFRYTLFGNHAGGTYDGINRQHAHLNSPATYAWVKGREKEPMTVRFHPPQGSNWKVATQLKPTENKYTFTAPNVAYLMDSPTELSNFEMETWPVHSSNKDYTMRMAMHHTGTHQQFESYLSMAKKVVNEEKAVYGEFPDYDYGTYTFIIDFLPYVYRDGMEHRNSTIITSKHPLSDHPLQRLYALAHEFFHCWNVERMRPEGIKPFNFERANMSRALWFAEGFTNYYDDLAIRRAGLIDDAAYAQGWDGVLNYVLNSPGSHFYSAVEMSMQSPFVDAATSIDEQNKSNTYISYYSWGSVIGLGLDLTLRERFDDITLDDYMRAVWKKYGKTEIAYSVDDLQQTLGEVTGEPAFAKKFFDDHIKGQQMVDLKPLLARAGFLLQKVHPGQAVISFGNAKIDFKNGQATVASTTTIGSPLYKAGLDEDDVIEKIDGRSMGNARELQQMLVQHQPGDSLSVTFTSLGQKYTHFLILAEDPALQVVPFEKVDKKVTPAIKSLRDSWIGSKAALK